MMADNAAQAAEMPKELATVKAPTLVLPTVKSAPSKRWIDQRFVVIGPGGIGKSGLWANGDDTYFEDTEGNLSHLSVKSLRCRSLDDFRQHYLALYTAAQSGNFPYDTTIVDTFDKLLDFCEVDAIATARKKYERAIKEGKIEINTIGDVPEGNGWNWVTKTITTILENLDKLPSATVIITHPKSVKVKEPTGEYDKETVAAWGQIGQKLLGWSHHNMHLQAMMSTGTLKRIVRTVPQRGLEGKSHGGLVKDGWEWKTRDLAAEYKELRSWFD